MPTYQYLKSDKDRKLTRALPRAVSVHTLTVCLIKNNYKFDAISE